MLPPLLTYRNINLSTTGQVIKTGAGQVCEYYIYNTGAAVVYVKFYNKATAPSSSDTPVRTYAIPATNGANLTIPMGLDFSTGISVRASTGVADNDNTAPSANQVIVNIGYL
jgi:hypothetical protein